MNRQQAKIPYADYWVSQRYFHFNSRRYNVRLTHKVTGQYTYMTWARYLMSVHLGVKIEPKYDVHHVNGNPVDDRIQNLQIILRSKHAKLHALKDGMPDNRKYIDGIMVQCIQCNKEFRLSGHRRADIDKILKRNTNSFAGKFCSNICKGIYQRGKKRGVFVND